MKFSERIGKIQPKVAIQLDSMDDDLKNSLWNILLSYIIEPIADKFYLHETEFEPFIVSIWFSFLKEPKDQIPSRTDKLVTEFRKRFFSWNYLEVYDFIEFIASEKDIPCDKIFFIQICNFVLKRELSGYRFVNEQLIQITSEIEISEIEGAIDTTSSNGLKGVHIHLSEALNKLSDKKIPDYRNSIKESISAVESLCREITENPNATLSNALKELKTKMTIHPSLEQGFNKLYGYAGDGDGIRHALMDESTLDQEDAIYMLVTCSAFINYLISKANKAGIALKP